MYFVSMFSLLSDRVAAILSHGSQYLFCMESYSFLCEANLSIDGFNSYLVVKKVENAWRLCSWACRIIQDGGAQCRTINVRDSDTIFEEEGLTLTNINIR